VRERERERERESAGTVYAHQFADRFTFAFVGAHRLRANGERRKVQIANTECGELMTPRHGGQFRTIERDV
jgi:uncharacterized ParB-like nuclease family protein